MDASKKAAVENCGRFSHEYPSSLLLSRLPTSTTIDGTSEKRYRAGRRTELFLFPASTIGRRAFSAPLYLRSSCTTHFLQQSYWATTIRLCYLLLQLCVGARGRIRPPIVDTTAVKVMANGNNITKIHSLKECFHRYAGSADQHAVLSEWMQRRNTTHYSPISPAYQQALQKLEKSEQMTNGLQITSGATSMCRSRRSRRKRVISSNAPLRERALCPFEHVLNYNPKRIPSTLTEAKCSCNQPPHHLAGRRMLECELLHYQVRVLLFDESCLTYAEHMETIAIACIPVQQAMIKASEGDDEYNNKHDDDDGTLVHIPAEVAGLQQPF